MPVPTSTTYDLSWLTGDIIAAQRYHQGRVEALYRGEATGPLYIAGPAYGRSHGLWGTNEIDMLADPEAWLDDVLAGMAAHAADLADRATFRPLGMMVDPLGVHYVDALFGAHVYIYEEQTWAEELSCEVAELTMPDLARSEVFRQSLRLVERAVAVAQRPEAQGCMFVSLPVMSCPINIGINLFGQRLLTALIEQPAAAHRALRIITDVIIACTRAFLDVMPAHIWRNPVAESRYAPPGYGYINGCATQLVSARQYRAFFGPLDAEILGVYPHGGMIHLCGAHAQHIPTWRDLPVVRSVQLNDHATDDVERFFHGLRPDQILYIAPSDAMPAARILEITRGERLVLQCPAPEG